MKKSFCMFFILLWLLKAGLISLAYAAPKSQQLRLAYLTQALKAPPALSNLDVFIPNKGEPGAELAITDNNTTGKFTGQTFILDKFTVPLNGDVLKVYNDKIAAKYAFVLLNLPAPSLLAIADIKTPQPHMFLDVASRDDALRNEQCRANMLHLQPNRAMRADALAQFMLKKRWQKWFLVIGQAPEDDLYAEAIKRAAKRFGLKLVAEKRWEHT